MALSPTLVKSSAIKTREHIKICIGNIVGNSLRTEDAMETKKEIRKAVLLKRDALTEQVRKACDEKIRKQMIKFPCYLKADVILAYVSYRSEVDTIELIEQALMDGKRVFVPKVAGDEMEFWQIGGLYDLQSGYQGILEPGETLSYPEYCASNRSSGRAVPTLMWMPGAVFDKMCHRIGYGKGFYDKYLERLYKTVNYDVRCGEEDTFTTVAMAYECQVLEQIPNEIHDYRPDFLLTECGLTEKRMTERGKDRMEYLENLGRLAVTAKQELQGLTTEQKNCGLESAAKALIDRQEEILEANAKDYEVAKESGMAEGLLDRLQLTPARIEAMAEGLMQIVQLPDPIGEIMDSFDRPNGLHIDKVRVPMGVIGIIYEARPNVTADAFGLCFKTGNAVILKGGKDAFYSNLAITKVIRDALQEIHITADAIQLIENNDRAVTTAFMQLKQYVDILIPRGGAGLIRAVVENSTIPVIETGTGNCHIYVDEDADLTKAIPIIINAKTQRIGVCNACESLLIHEKIADRFLPELGKALQDKHVEIRGDKKVVETIPGSLQASEEDYGTEYLDYIVSMKTVSSVEEAIAHINRYNTRHSDAILTENEQHMEQFLKGVDSACVYANASTRFTDGFEFGFGAEIGISTQKLHARGPMGLKELTTYKYMIKGNGQIRK